MTKNLRQRLRRVLPNSVAGHIAYLFGGGRVSYSQYGEDTHLLKLFDQPRGFYIDIGAFHPKFGSNTYQLWRRGWHGINIDVDRYKMRLFERYRPGDINLTTAVSSENSARPFYYQEGESYGSMSSLEEDFARDREATHQRRVASREVEVETLNTILDRHLPRDAKGHPTVIDLVNIDVEGHELRILEALDFDRYRPRAWCIEIHAASAQELLTNPTYRLLQEQGYLLKAWPAPSCIFVDGRAIENRDATPSERQRLAISA